MKIVLIILGVLLTLFKRIQGKDCNDLASCDEP